MHTRQYTFPKSKDKKQNGSNTGDSSNVVSIYARTVGMQWSPTKSPTESQGLGDYIIKKYINCNSTNFVYMIKYSECTKKYIGCTTRRLKVRILKHLNNISNPGNQNISYVARHFIDCHHSHVASFSFHGIKKI